MGCKINCVSLAWKNVYTEDKHICEMWRRHPDKLAWTV